MEIENFTQRNPYLYHLTDADNFATILETSRILSTKNIVEASNIPNQDIFLGSKRKSHTSIEVDDKIYKIRDQQPISEVVLARSLTNDWTNADFIKHLNRRVFMWPTVDRLERHFKRYEQEQPLILRFRSSDILNLHPQAEFCRLNSGATRCNAQWKGNAPERGPNTFVTAEHFNQSPRHVAEVTVPDFLNLPMEFWTATSPQGPWTLHTIIK